MATPICPEHQLELELTTYGRTRLLACPIRGCPTARAPERKRQPADGKPRAAAQPKLPGMDPGRQLVRVAIEEDPAQAAIVKELLKLGYTVLVTSRRHKKAWCMPADGGCGRRFWSHSSDGCDKGIPDLLISHSWWPPYLWLGMECKGTETRLSKEQRALAEAGRIRVVRAVGSVDQAVQMAVEAVREFEARLPAPAAG